MAKSLNDFDIPKDKESLNEVGILATITAVTMLIFVYSLIEGLIRYLIRMNLMKHSVPKKDWPLNQKLTDKIVSITNNELIRVYEFKSDKNDKNEQILEEYAAYTYAAGYDDTIYLGRSLVENAGLTESELIAICLHEYGHILHKSGRRREASESFTFAMILFFVLLIIYPIGLMFSYVSVQLIAITFAMFGSKKIIPKVLSKQYISDEYASDSYAKEMGYGRELASALDKLAIKIQNLQCGYMDLSTAQCSLLKSIRKASNTHPSVDRRIERLSNLMKPVDITASRLISNPKTASPSKLKRLLKFLNKAILKFKKFNFNKNDNKEND